MKSGPDRRPYGYRCEVPAVAKWSARQARPWFGRVTQQSFAWTESIRNPRWALSFPMSRGSFPLPVVGKCLTAVQMAWAWERWPALSTRAGYRAASEVSGGMSKRHSAARSHRQIEVPGARTKGYRRLGQEHRRRRRWQELCGSAVVESAAAAAAGLSGYVGTAHLEQSVSRCGHLQAQEAAAAVLDRPLLLLRTHRRPSHRRHSFATWPRPISSSLSG